MSGRGYFNIEVIAFAYWSIGSVALRIGDPGPYQSYEIICFLKKMQYHYPSYLIEQNEEADN